MKEKLKSHDITYKKSLSPEAKDLLKRLLRHKPEERISLEEIFKHPFILKHLDEFENNKEAFKHIPPEPEWDNDIDLNTGGGINGADKQKMFEDELLNNPEKQQEFIRNMLVEQKINSADVEKVRFVRDEFGVLKMRLQMKDRPLPKRGNSERKHTASIGHHFEGAKRIVDSSSPTKIKDNLSGLNQEVKPAVSAFEESLKNKDQFFFGQPENRPSEDNRLESIKQELPKINLNQDWGTELNTTTKVTYPEGTTPEQKLNVPNTTPVENINSIKKQESLKLNPHPTTQNLTQPISSPFAKKEQGQYTSPTNNNPSSYIHQSNHPTVPLGQTSQGNTTTQTFQSSETQNPPQYRQVQGQSSKQQDYMNPQEKLSPSYTASPQPTSQPVQKIEPQTTTHQPNNQYTYQPTIKHDPYTTTTYSASKPQQPPKTTQPDQPAVVYRVSQNPDQQSLENQPKPTQPLRLYSQTTYQNNESKTSTVDQKNTPSKDQPVSTGGSISYNNFKKDATTNNLIAFLPPTLKVAPHDSSPPDQKPYQGTQINKVNTPTETGSYFDTYKNMALGSNQSNVKEANKIQIQSNSQQQQNQGANSPNKMTTYQPQQGAIGSISSKNTHSLNAFKDMTERKTSPKKDPPSVINSPISFKDAYTNNSESYTDRAKVRGNTPPLKLTQRLVPSSDLKTNTVATNPLMGNKLFKKPSDIRDKSPPPPPPSKLLANNNRPATVTTKPPEEPIRLKTQSDNYTNAHQLLTIGSNENLENTENNKKNGVTIQRRVSEIPPAITSGNQGKQENQATLNSAKDQNTIKYIGLPPFPSSSNRNSNPPIPNQISKPASQETYRKIYSNMSVVDNSTTAKPPKTASNINTRNNSITRTSQPSSNAPNSLTQPPKPQSTPSQQLPSNQPSEEPKPLSTTKQYNAPYKPIPSNYHPLSGPSTSSQLNTSYTRAEYPSSDNSSILKHLLQPNMFINTTVTRAPFEVQNSSTDISKQSLKLKETASPTYGYNQSASNIDPIRTYTNNNTSYNNNTITISSTIRGPSSIN